MKVYVSNIKWDIDFEEDLLDYVDSLTAEKAAGILGIPKRTYSNMSTEERHDWIYSAVHHNRLAAEDILGIPDCITIDVDEENHELDENTISDSITEKTGYCHKGFSFMALPVEENLICEEKCPKCGESTELSFDNMDEVTDLLNSGFTRT